MATASTARSGSGMPRAEGRAFDRMEEVHRDRVGRDVAEGEREFDELLVRFAHPDDSATADRQSEAARGAERFEFLRLRVRGAERGEERGRGLKIAVQARESGVLELCEVLLGDESERAAKFNAGRAPHRAEGVAKFVDIGGSLCTAARHDADAVGAVRLGFLCGLSARFRADPTVALAAGFPVRTLGAPLAVLEATPRPRVDDRAEVEVLRRERGGDAVRRLAQLLPRRLTQQVEQFLRRGGGATGDQPVGEGMGVRFRLIVQVGHFSPSGTVKRGICICQISR